VARHTHPPELHAAVHAVTHANATHSKRPTRHVAMMLQPTICIALQVACRACARWSLEPNPVAVRKRSNWFHVQSCNLRFDTS
jgi:hypothetical protein